MLARIRRLLAAPVFEDEEKTRVASLLNVILLLIIVLVPLYAIFSIYESPSLSNFLSMGALVLVSLFLLFLLRRGLRRGRVRLAALILSGALWTILTLGTYAAGGLFGTGPDSYFGLVLIVGLLLGGRAGFVFAGLSIVATLGMAYAHTIGVLARPENSAYYTWEEFSATLVGVAALLYLAIRSINAGFDQARKEKRAQEQANRELEATRASLEQQVAERTKELTQRTDDLARMVATQERLLETIREMSVPVVPVTTGIIVLPLVGTIDSQRGERVVAALLAGIEAHQARVALVDITGVPVVDTQVAQLLLEATTSARLLGTQVVLVGIRPEVAQTIVGLGVDLSKITTRADLQGGVEYALRASGRDLAS